MKNGMVLFGLSILCVCAAAFADSWSTELFASVEQVAWNQPGHQLELTCKKDPSPSGSSYNYKYDWNATGNSLEHAKVLLSMLLTAQTAGNKFNIYGDHNGPTPIWNNFSSLMNLRN